MNYRFAIVLILAEWDWTSPELPVDNWWFFTIVLVLLVFFIWAIARLTTRTTDDIDPAEIDRQMLTAVSELRSQGELTQEEFRSIKGRLVERLSNKPASAESNGSRPEANAANVDDRERKPDHNSESNAPTGEESPEADLSKEITEEDSNDSTSLSAGDP